MSIQDTYSGRPSAPPPNRARNFPVPSDHAVLYRIEARRRAAMRAAHPEKARAQVGPWGAVPPAPPAAPRENRVTRILRRVDHLALGLMSAWVLAQWPLAFSLLLGWL